MTADPTRHDNAVDRSMIAGNEDDPVLDAAYFSPAAVIKAIDRPARVRGTMAENIVHVRHGRSAPSMHQLWGRHDPWEDRRAWACGPAGRYSDAEGVAEEGASK